MKHLLSAPNTLAVQAVHKNTDKLKRLHSKDAQKGLQTYFLQDLWIHRIQLDCILGLISKQHITAAFGALVGQHLLQHQEIADQACIIKCYSPSG